MKPVLRLILVLALAFAAWAAWTYPQVGALALHHGAALEARAYGLNKTRTDIGDLELVAFEGGDSAAPAIVMIHGYTADKDVWMRFGRHFVDGYRVLIPDLAGHGETGTAPDGDYSIAAQAARVAALLDAKGIESAHIVGNSMGGFITAYFATHYPQRTLSTGLFDPAGRPSTQPSDMETMLAAGENPFLVTDRESFARFYPMTMARPPWLPGFVLDAVAQRYVDRRELHARIFEQISDFDLLEGKLERLKAPALLVWGREDRLLHVSAVPAWQAAVPHIEVEIMDGIGHMPMVEAPAPSARRYAQFLNAVSAGR